jgi:ABC-2 type transport system permease protein
MDSGSEEWLDWITHFHFGMVVPLWCLIAFGSIVRDEVQAGTIGFLLTRPMTRARFVVLRWCCTLIAVQVPLALNTVLLGVVAIVLGVPSATSLTLLLLAIQTAVVPAYGAIAAFLGLLTRKYLLFGLTYGFVVEIGIGQIPTNINTLSVSRHFSVLLAHSELIVQGGGWSVEEVCRSLAALVILASVYLTAGTWLFHIREYSQSEEHKQ